MHGDRKLACDTLLPSFAVLRHERSQIGPAIVGAAASPQLGPFGTAVPELPVVGRSSAHTHYGALTIIDGFGLS